MKFTRLIFNIFSEFKFLVIVFSIFLISVFSYFSYIKNYKIIDYFENRNKSLLELYQATYENFRVISENTFYGIINKEIISDSIKNAQKSQNEEDTYRNKLYTDFLKDYERIKLYKFNIVNFYFKNNKVFLRMDNPEDFGELSTRSSILNSNSVLKPVNGYDIGKYYDAFRFVYPIHDKNLEHIGSVEIAIPSKFFEQKFEESQNIDVHFLTKNELLKRNFIKDIFAQYKMSNENNKYLYYEQLNEKNHYIYENFFNQNELSSIRDKMDKGENFYLAKDFMSKKIAIFFLPIMTLDGGSSSTYMVISEDSKTLNEIENNYEKVIFILLLITITFLIVLKYQYEKILQNHKKEEILSQQAKMIAMGEMIENIAHQWRQPLSIISTVASGVKLEKEVGILDDKNLVKFMDTIVYQSLYLSETIDDFRNFFDKDRRREIVNIDDLIDKSLSVFGNSFKDSNIEIVLNIEKFSVSTYPNDLKQVIINILKNAKDAIVQDGVIIIKCYTSPKNKCVYVKIQDSGGGISNEIKNKIFEPYFTTKHKSQGTGIGLYMSYNIVNKHLDGSIEVENQNFDYNFKKLYGALFTIELKNLKIYEDKKNEN